MFKYLLFVSALTSVALCAPQYYGGPVGHYGPAASPAPLGPDGRVVDTPEVAHLKAAHLAALAEATARAPKGGPDPYYGPSAHYAAAPVAAYHHGGAYPSAPAAHYAPSAVGHYSGPPAPLGPDGRVVDTAEVQHAKAVHFSLYNAEAARVPHGPEESGHYNAPLGNPGYYNPGYNHY